MRAARSPASLGASAPPFDEAVAWHDVECGAYAADLPLWRELPAARPGPVLELGAGTGRVALDLAAGGHEVTALDSDPVLVAACAERARARGLRVEAVCADARSFSLGRRFALVLAPMQVVQLLEDARGRDAMLLRVLDHLNPGGLLALALADPFAGLPAADSLPPLPDTGDRGGWALASTPVAVREEGAARGARTVAIDRLRRAVSPHGEIVESAATVRLSILPPAELAARAVAHGFQRLPDRSVPETEGYVGSTVLMLEVPRRP
ncbi:MAG TPA: class I SAM-dependent methyltransferase [Thermoleophilaceae bacterium]|nr:class I SAM-dependent methyltransferase [Thermoleophilaceae bacterium]